METKLLRHKVTGKIAQFPAHFVDYDYLEEINPEEAPCCGGDEPAFLEPPAVEVEADEELETEDEPTSTKKGRGNK